MNITTDSIIIANIHSHIVPYVDDGAKNMETALTMIKMEYDQGVRMLICTSHNGYSANYIQNYLEKFLALKTQVAQIYPDLKLLFGNEIYCTKENIDDILDSLAKEVILPLENTKHVLVEFPCCISFDDTKVILKKLLSHGWKPIVAHCERYENICSRKIVKKLILNNIMIQINLYSLEEESSECIKERARMLFKNKFIHFVGSDCHGIHWRSPSLDKGVAYIKDHTDSSYQKDILFKNAAFLFEQGRMST